MKRKTAIILVFIFLLLNIPTAYAGSESVTVIAVTDSSFDIESFENREYGIIKSIYTEIMSGFCIETYEKYLVDIKNFPGIIEVYEENTYSVPEVFNSEDSFSFFNEKAGYLGEGAVVAVVDSSFNIDHPIFSGVQDAEYTLNDISGIFANNTLNAEQSYQSIRKKVLNAENVYKSSKVPFAFDYAHTDTGVYSSQFHGNAVAGIIGGNASDYKGVLPNTQLLLMKVATDGGSIVDSAILDAFEDATLLNADAVNLSIGSLSGFSEGFLGGAAMNTVFDNMKKKGVFVSVASGNSGILNSNGLSKDDKGGNYPYAANPDYGLISSPASAVSANAVAAADYTSGMIAAFSSGGVTPDLILKPDITAKGTGWQVADVKGYKSKLQSGTSFASPELCAKAVIVKKELEKRGVSSSEITALTENILYSTADILYNTDDIAISPRYQGSGLLDVAGAITAEAVLYGEDGKAKINLFDGFNKTLSFKVNIKNLTDKCLSYTPSVELVTDGLNQNRISGKTVEVPHGVSLSPSVISLSSGETKTVTVNINVNESFITKNLEKFTNGFYLEGYVKFLSDNELLSIPFLSYYGDWKKVPALITDKISYGFGFADMLDKKIFYLGNNYYKGGNNTYVPDSSKVAFSPNNDGKLDTAKIFFGLYRNARLIYWEIYDKDRKAVLDNGLLYIPKACGMEILESCFWDGKDKNGKLLSDGQYYMYAQYVPDYGEGYNPTEDCVRPIYLDTTPPELSDFEVFSENGKKYLDFNISDNHYIQVGAVSDLSGNLIDMNTNITDEICRLDITGKSGDLIVESADYAFNFAEEKITVADEYIAFFNSSGIITRITADETVLVDGAPLTDYNNTVIKEDEAYAKVFIWSEALNPLYNTIIYK